MAMFPVGTESRDGTTPSTMQWTQYNWEFLAETPEKLMCGICAELMMEPHLPTCCGQTYLCIQCVAKIRLHCDRLSGKPVCPFCRTEDFETAVDVDLQDTILNLEVRCAHRNNGCIWTGKLRDGMNHLSVDCIFHPVNCPNICGKMIQRCQLEQHRKLCPNQAVQCPFLLAGCSSRLRRRDLPAHLQESEQEHLQRTSVKVCQLSTRCTAVTSSLQASHEKLRKEKEAQIAGLNLKISEMQENVSLLEQTLRTIREDINEFKQGEERCNAQYTAELRAKDDEIQDLRDLDAALRRGLAGVPTPRGGALTTPPLTFELDNFEERRSHSEEWMSPPFYSCSQGGYKMCLVVYPNGWGSGLGTHLSMYIHFMHGEYDAWLQWPFEGGRFTIVLENQQNFLSNFVLQSFQSTHGNYRKIISMDTEKSVGYRSRVFDGTRGLGWGYDQFIPLAQLGPYISRDMLKIKILPILFFPL